jgi:hypothetical protein
MRLNAHTTAAVRRKDHLVGTVPYDGGKIIIAFDKAGRRVWGRTHWMHDDEHEGMDIPVMIEPPGRTIVCSGPETLPEFWQTYAPGGKKLPPLPPVLD